MPLLDITNPKIINFLLENYETETKIRMRWLDLHKDQLQEYATFKSESNGYSTGDVNKASIISGMTVISRDHILSKVHRKKTPVQQTVSATFTIKEEDTREIIKTMMPVKKSIKKLLLESKKDYLKERNEISPEDKYYFMESTNWNYGWKLNDSELKMRGCLYGKVSHLQQENIVEQDHTQILCIIDLLKPTIYYVSSYRKPIK